MKIELAGVARLRSHAKSCGLKRRSHLKNRPRQHIRNGVVLRLVSREEAARPKLTEESRWQVPLQRPVR